MTIFECSINGFKLHLSQILISTNITGLSSETFLCQLTKFSYLLSISSFSIFIAVINFIVLLLLFLRSEISGKFRWLIINQIFWNLVTVLEYHSFNPAYFLFEENLDICERSLVGYCTYGNVFLNNFGYISYSALFLSAFFKFLESYIPKFYEIITQQIRLAIFILSVNFVMILLVALKPQPFISVLGKKAEYHADESVYKIIIDEVLSLVFLLLSLIFAILVFQKSLKSNSQETKIKFGNSFHISFVLCFQILVNILLFSFQILKYLDSSSEWLNPIWGFPSEINYPQIKLLRAILETLSFLTFWPRHRRVTLDLFQSCFPAPNTENRNPQSQSSVTVFHQKV